MRQALRRSLLVLLGLITALILAVLIAGGVLLGTEPGSRWLIQKVQPLAPGELRIGEFSGTLIGELRARDVHWRNGELEVSLTELKVNWSPSYLLGGQIMAETLHLDDLTVRLPPPSGDDAEAPSAPPDIRLPLAIAVQDGRLDDLLVTRSDEPLLALDRVVLDDGRWRRYLRFDRLDVTQGQVSATVRGELMLAPPHRLDLSLDWRMPLPDAVHSRLGGEHLAGRASLGGTLSHIRGRHRLKAPFAMASRLMVQPFASPLVLDVASEWQRIELRRQDGPLTLEAGRLRLHGSPQALKARGASRITAQPLGTVQLALEASGDLQHAEQLRVDITRGNATARATGSVTWLPALMLDVRLAGENLNPAEILDGWPGALSLEGRLRGARQPDGLRLSLTDARLQGELRDQRVSARGDGGLSPDGAVNLDTHLTWGNNRARVHGTLSEDLSVQGTFDVDEPDLLLDDLTGSLTGRFSLRGPRDAPRLNLSASGPRLGYSALRMDEPSLRVQGLGLQSDRIALDLEAAGISREGDSLLTGFAASASGSAERHTLTWRARNEQLAIEGTAQGGVDEEPLAWAGRLTSLLLVPQAGPLGPWRLQDPAPLRLSAQQMALKQACILGAEGRLCATLNRSPDATRIDAGITDLPLVLANLFMPEFPATLEGDLDASVSLSSTGGSSWSGTLEAKTDHGALEVEDGGDALRLEFETLTADATLTDNQLNARARLDIAGHGGARLELGTNLQRPDAPLDGTLTVNLDEWRWLSLFLPQVADVTGDLKGELKLAGTRQRPDLDGEIALRDGAARLPRAGVALTNIRLKADGNGRHIALAGSGESGPGRFTVTGNLHPFPNDERPLVKLDVRGKRVEVVNLRDMHVLASPDLALRLDNEVLHVRGEVHIPEATIAPQQPPRQAIQVSEDQVLVREMSEDGEEPADPIAVDMNVILTLGDGVTFEGFGLKAEPRGRVTLLQTPARPLRLRGELSLEKGRYRAYGQNLQITRGVLLFQDKPDNPGLDIRAVRRIPSANVEVGVEITGTLKQPEASIFSNPPMEESEAMAWLLTGRSLSGTSESENARIAEVLALYGLEQGSGITQEIGEKLGVDEISIGSTWETQDAALMLGKRLSDRLYLRYAAGLFDAVSTVMLRYTLSRRLHLEATTGGSQQSLDLIYQFEK